MFTSDICIDIGMLEEEEEGRKNVDSFSRNNIINKLW